MADREVYYCEAGKHAVKYGIFFTSGTRIIRYRCSTCGTISCAKHIVKKLLSRPQCSKCKSKQLVKERIADGVWRNE